MESESDNPNDFTEELEPRDELFEVTRALRAHVEILMQGGAFGVPKAPPAVAVASITEPPPSFAPPPHQPQQPQTRQQSPQVPSVQSGQPLTPPGALQSAEGPRPTPPRAPTAATPTFVMPDVPPRHARPAAAVAAAAPKVVVPALSLEEKHQRLTVLGNSIVGCTRCALHAQRTQTVFARGSSKSGLCFVGEGPGADEDVQGFPFVGAAGQLLDRMITAMGLGRDEVYVCNIVKCRPPENRKPLPEEMAACRPYLEEQLELLAPEVIVALGATAVEGLLGVPSGGITRLRGTWKLYKGRIAVMPTFHPAYLLRVPNAKHDVWADMQSVLRHMGRTVPVRGKQ